MKATAALVAEHEGILRMLAVLDRVSADLRRVAPVPQGDLESIVEFLQVFADACHHAKEEEVLFPALEAAGMSRSGPIAVMLHEHELGRGHIRAMAQALQAGTLKEACAPAEAYSALLRAHIAKENTVLFPMADRLLSAETQELLWERFERIEEERIGVGRHEAFHTLLDTLENTYGTV